MNRVSVGFCQRIWNETVEDSDGCRRGILRLAALVVVGSTCCSLHSVRAQDTDDYFRQKCFSCHTIGGGPLTGPD